LAFLISSHSKVIDEKRSNRRTREGLIPFSYTIIKFDSFVRCSRVSSSLRYPSLDAFEYIYFLLSSNSILLLGNRTGQDRLQATRHSIKSFYMPRPTSTNGPIHIGYTGYNEYTPFHKSNRLICLTHIVRLSLFQRLLHLGSGLQILILTRSHALLFSGIQSVPLQK
jgi:hypothetical protein